MTRVPLIGTLQLFLLSLFITHVFVVNQAFSADRPSFIINESAKSQNLGIHTQYLEDVDNQFTIDDLLNEPEHSGKFQWLDAPSYGITQGYTQSAYWLKFKVRSTANTRLNWNMEFAYPVLDTIEIFQSTNNNNYKKTVTGDHLPFSERTIEYRNIVIPLSIEPAEVSTFYIKVKTVSSMNVPIIAWPMNSFYKEVDSIKLMLGILYGAVILAFISALMNSVFLKDVMYLWLSFSFVIITLYLSSIKGISYQYLWPNSDWWSTVNIPFFVCLGYIPTLQYCRLFTNTKELWPNFDKLCVAIMGVSLVATALSLFLSYEIMIRYSTASATVYAVVCITAGALSWFKGNTSARLYVIAWALWFIGSVSFALTALGILPRTFITTWSQEVGLFFFVILMTIAQFDRFLQLQKRHEKSQKKSLSAIKNAEQKYRSLFENAIEGIFQLNHNGVLINVNNAFSNILGIEDPEELVETRDAAFTLGFLSETEAKKLQTLLDATESVTDYKISFASSTGEIRWASASIQKVQCPNTNKLNYEGSLTDITETKKREQAEKQRRMAEASTEAKSMFLANMSHEIRTPMNAIIGFTDLAVNANKDQKLADFLRKIKTSSANLLGIINDILDFSKIEAGKLKIEAVPFHIRELLDNINDIVSSNIESKGLKFDISIDDDIPGTLIGDSLRLHQILLNLINNAVKFTLEGEVKVEIDLLAMNKKTGSIKFVGRIIDTGIGISKEKQQKLFTSFSQADESTTRNFGGTGLGLSISKQLIELMGGEITVRSVEGKGSVFEFSICCRLESRKRRPVFGSQSEHFNILIVDDNQDSRQLIQNVVESLGHEYKSAESSDEALQALREQTQKGMPFDLVLIDWFMPGTDGLACRDLIADDTHISPVKTILVTTYGEEGLAEKALNSGFDAFLEKPINKHALERDIDRLLNSEQCAPSLPANNTSSQAPSLETGSPADTVPPVDAKPQPLGSPPSDIINSNSAQAQSKQPLVPANISAKDYYDFSGINILLVEDVPMNQELANEILTQQGIRLTMANNGQIGVDKAKMQRFDAILMDMQMPIMDGCEASRAIRDFDQDIPIIAMTANAMSEDKSRCLAAGMNDYIAKPINDNELFSVIARQIKTLEVKQLAPSPPSAVATPSIKQAAPVETVVENDKAAHSSEKKISSEKHGTEELEQAAEDSIDAAINTRLIQNTTTPLNTAPETSEPEPIDLETSAPEASTAEPTIPEEKPSNTDEPSQVTEQTLPDSLPTIDLKDGLDRCQGNQKLYLKLLGDFIRNYGDSTEEIKTFMAQSDNETVARLAHTLKGLSANLGAKILSAAAMKLEHAVDMPKQDQEESLALFDIQLSALISDLQQVLSSMPSESGSVGIGEQYAESELKDKLTELSAMINEQKMEAYDQAVILAAHWPIAEHSEHLEKLVELLDLFDFDEAKNCVTEIDNLL